MMRVTLFSWLLLCLLFSCKTAKQDDANKFSFLALGDSYTVGKSVSQNASWPYQLKDSLKNNGYKLARPTIIAKTGWRSSELLQAVKRNLKDEDTYDLVSVLIGVNDQYHNGSLADYEKNLIEIFKEAIAHSKRGRKGVFAINIPDYGSASFFIHRSEGIARDIDAFNAVFRRVASSYQIPVYDVNSISKLAYTNKDLVAIDELHASGAQYALWVSEILPKVRLMLK